MAIVPEPTAGRIITTTGGFVYFQITTWGIPSATFFIGSVSSERPPDIDAIEKMFKIVEALNEWIPKYRKSNILKGEPATNAAIISIHGGLAFRPSKVPPICKLFLEVDTMPGQHNMNVVQEVEALIEKVKKEDPDMKVDVQTLAAAVGSEISSEEHIVKVLSKFHKKVTSNEANINWCGYFADTTALTMAGIPALCYGPGGRVRTGGSNYYPQEGEHCYLPDIADGVKIFIGTSMEVCSMTRDEYCNLQVKEKNTVV